VSRRALDPAELAVVLSAALTEARIPHAIGGAIAYGFWGNPRGTGDLDVNLFLGADQALDALEALRAAGMTIDVEKVLATARDRGDARVFYDDIPVDLFFSSIPLHESAAARTVTVTLSNRRIPILSAEDLIVLKMLFFRGKDVVDVERVRRLDALLGAIPGSR
jgi:hypothetical protein